MFKMFWGMEMIGCISYESSKWSSLCLCDSDGKIVEYGGGFSDLFGVGGLRGRYLVELVWYDGMDFLFDILDLVCDGFVGEYVFRFVGASGRLFRSEVKLVGVSGGGFWLMIGDLVD